MISSAVVDLVKLGAGFVVSSGVSTMVGYAAKSSIPKVAPHIIRSRPMLVSGWKLFQKVAIPAGAAALAGMASEQAVKYTEKRIDENVLMAEKMKVKIDETVKKTMKDSKTESPEDK